MSDSLLRAHAVFEGGGVKGSGLVGAVAYAESLGYRWECVAGTSAGAVVASLIAVGYTGLEMKRILEEVDYRRFKDPSFVGRLPLIGPALSLFTQLGLYKGDYLSRWLGGLIKAKAGTADLCFGELRTGDRRSRYKYRLRVVASDIARGRLLVLPQDIAAYGIDPDRLRVVDAVRMSAGLPFFYRPVPLRYRSETSWIVDGGILSNFPVWLFDAPAHEAAAVPTFGFKLVEPDAHVPRTIRGPITLLEALFATMMEAHDARYIKEHNFARTIAIPTLGVGTVEFDLSLERRRALFRAGEEAARKFFARWNFRAFLDAYGRRIGVEEAHAHR